MNGFDLGAFCVARRHDQLAALAEWYTVRGAKFVQHTSSADTMKGAQRPGRVVQSRVDDLAVARGNSGANASSPLRDDHSVSIPCQCPRAGQSDHTGADDEDLHGCSNIFLGDEESTTELPLDTAQAEGRVL